MSDEGVAIQVAAGIYGAALLDKIDKMLRRFVSARDHVWHVCALWVLHCWAIDAFHTTGRLIIESPEPECGKSTLLDVMALMLDDPVSDVSITGAAVARILQQRTTEFLLDECDKNIGRKDADQVETFSLLLAIANGGYRRGKTRTVCLPPKWEPTKLPIFAPMAFAGLNSTLDKPFRTRAIHLWLDRDDPPEEFEWSEELDEEFKALRGEIKEWVDNYGDVIKATKLEKKDRPEGLKARLAEVWLPLFRIAAVVGDPWPERISAAFETLARKSQRHRDRDLSLRLLAATWDAPWVSLDGEERIHTHDLLSSLNGRDESWARWNDGEGILPYEFTRHVIDHFNLHHPQSIRIGDENRKGYKRDWFRDAYDRYVPPRDDDSDPPDLSTPSNARHTVTTLMEQGKEGDTTDGVVTGTNRLHPLSGNGCVGVSGSRGEWREGQESGALNPDEWEAAEIASLDPDDPDHGQKVAELRAEEIRRRRRFRE
jgi:hypothetical protein